MRRRSLALAVLLGLGAVGCGTGSSTSSTRHGVRIVAAENTWGSLASQLGGARADVASVITNPNADPHDYEPTTQDARTMAGAQLAIVDGIGYDTWADRLLAANPVSGRIVVNVGDVVGVAPGGNPHQWYSPASVQKVIDRIVAACKRLDPEHAAYFDRRRRLMQTRGLARYRALIAQIRGRYRGTPVGASESVFAPLAASLGLRLLTPADLLNAISEGTDPTAADKQAADRQLAGHAVKVWVYNSQNITPDVERLNATARAAGIPITTVTETLTPAGASFQHWQVRQLEALRRALAAGTGR